MSPDLMREILPDKMKRRPHQRIDIPFIPHLRRQIKQAKRNKKNDQILLHNSSDRAPPKRDKICVAPNHHDDRGPPPIRQYREIPHRHGIAVDSADGRCGGVHGRSLQGRLIERRLWEKEGLDRGGLRYSAVVGLW